MRYDKILDDIMYGNDLSRIKRTASQSMRDAGWLAMAQSREVWKAIVHKYCKIIVKNQNQHDCRCTLHPPFTFRQSDKLIMDKYSGVWWTQEEEQHDQSSGKKQLCGIFNSANSIDELPAGVYSSGNGGCVNNGKIDAKAALGLVCGFRQGDESLTEVSEPVPEHDKQTNNKGEILAMRDQLAYHAVHTTHPQGAHIYTDSNYCALVIEGLARRHEMYQWQARPPNMAEMKQILGLMGLLGSRLHVHLVRSHTDATDIHVASKWNGRADDLASEGIAKDHQSAEYASFHERMKSIDWKTEDEEILRAVAEAVANLPSPTTTND